MSLFPSLGSKKEYKNELPEVEINTDSVRYYSHGKELVYVLCYTRRLTADQLKGKKELGYRLGDVIGQMGVEKAAEKALGNYRGAIAALALNNGTELIV